MQYDLTEEQVLLQTTVRRLAKEKVSPGAAGRGGADAGGAGSVFVFASPGRARRARSSARSMLCAE